MNYSWALLQHAKSRHLAFKACHRAAWCLPGSSCSGALLWERGVLVLSAGRWGANRKKKKKKRSVPGNWFYPTRRRKGGGIFVWDAVVHGFFPHLVFGTVVDMGQPGVPSSPWVFATCRCPQVSLDGSVKCRSIHDRHGDKWERLQVHPGAGVY